MEVVSADHVAKSLCLLTVEDDFGVIGGVPEVVLRWTTLDRLLLIREALVDVGREDTDDVLGAGHETDVEAAIAVDLLHCGTVHEDHVVLDSPVTESPTGNRVIGDVDLAVGHRVSRHRALGDKDALELSGEVTGRVTWGEEKGRVVVDGYNWKRCETNSEVQLSE